MSGRFFAMPFLVAVMTLLDIGARLATTCAPAAAALVLYNVLIPLAPVKTTGDYDAAWPWRSQNGIKDERGHYHRVTNVLFYSPFRDLPDQTWMREGHELPQRARQGDGSGQHRLLRAVAGPEKHVVDRNALSDPLLARLPVSPRLYFEFYSGHFFRDIPDGYLETLSSGQNRLTRSPAPRLLRAACNASCGIRC